ncbi:carbamoyltransferase C-terminal domain-containing protein [Candidatus Uabimicrobium amorphum]|uniref:Nodulation protein NolNO n=1 Tax=Uabimicrobium amorphum TaxID=2596890 RepID=A0A5S9IK48_UABAM|nr:carbamoyltransferase C-terminal domain-containing protein [Candidatus Uabimicrobium amorphum]BBM83338.1 nodulation protein NolNO [Candidatus Uabimicrobium amorphum]
MKPTLAIYGIQDRHNYDCPGYVHDHSLVLMEDGKVITYLHLERLTRRKHDNRMHVYIEDILEEQDFSLPDDFDVVFVDSFVGRSFISSSGKIRFEGPIDKPLATDVELGKCWWKNQERKAYVLNHELAHLYSCLPFYGNFQDNSMLIHFDGGASQDNFSAWLYQNDELKLLEYHWDLSQLSKYFNDNALTFAILGMKHYEHLAVPGKLMGYSCYGKYSPKIHAWLQKNDFFRDIWQDKTSFYHSAEKQFGWGKQQFDLKDTFLQDIAATFQYDFQTQLLSKLTKLQEQHQCEYLYLSGGCALNIIANTMIIDSGLLKEVYIPPCCGDSGLALGAASFVEQKKHKNIKLHSPYLNNFGIKHYNTNYNQETIKKVASLLLENKIIGVCNGYGEIGPRALGNRSLIALPNSIELRDKVSVYHKKREWYRPVAPIILERNAKKITGLSSIQTIAKYMLADFHIREEYKRQIPGVIHTNQSARIQSIASKDENPFMYDLLDYLDQVHKVLCLINTSFNKKGEPIVHTKENAIVSAKSMNIKVVVVNGEIIVL